MPFKLYLKEQDVPKYKGMDCYFTPPFIGIFNSAESFYYIIMKKDNHYWVMMHDEAYMSSMNGGAIVENDKSCKYQADEYFFDTKKELRNFLLKCDFDHDAFIDLKNELKKMKKFKKFEDNQLYITNENVYHLDEFTQSSWMTQSDVDKMVPYVTKGTMVILEDGVYVTKKGETIPIDEIAVTKIFKKTK